MQIPERIRLMGGTGIRDLDFILQSVVMSVYDISMLRCGAIDELDSWASDGE